MNTEASSENLLLCVLRACSLMGKADVCTHTKYNSTLLPLWFFSGVYLADVLLAFLFIGCRTVFNSSIC